MKLKLSFLLDSKMPRQSSTTRYTPSKANQTALTPRQPNPYSNVSNPSTHLSVEQPTLGQTLKQGFGFGAGSAIAHRIFGMSPTIIQAPSDKKVEHPCEKELVAFESCMKTRSTDDFCGNEQMSYTQCLHILSKNQ